MSNPRIALIHATPVAIQPIVAAFKRLWPAARTTNLLDDSLSADLAAEGSLSQRMIAPLPLGWSANIIARARPSRAGANGHEVRHSQFVLA